MILTISITIAVCLMALVIFSGVKSIPEQVRLFAFVGLASVALGCAVKLLEIVLK